MLSLVSYRITSPGIIPPTMGLAYSNKSLIKKVPYRAGEMAQPLKARLTTIKYKISICEFGENTKA